MAEFNPKKWFHNLDTLTYTAGSNFSPVVFKGIPETMNGQWKHLTKVHFDVVMTPTYGGAGADFPVLVGMNNIIATLQIHDGHQMKVNGNGGLNILRVAERMYHGQDINSVPDLDTASGTARYFRRTWYAGPPGYVGSPADFAIPLAMLRNGYIQGVYGTLAQLSVGAAGAGVTACTATIYITAEGVLLDEKRIPPSYELRTWPINNGQMVDGACALDFVALLNSTSYDAITAGDFDNLSLDVGFGDFINTTRAETLAASFHQDFKTGTSLGAFSGEPSAASDDNLKGKNGSTPTALAAAPNDVQPVLWNAEGSRINKLYSTPKGFKVSWNGTQASAEVVVGRILPTDEGQMAEKLVRADIDPTKWDAKIKTKSKKDYKGPMGAFMPVRAVPKQAA